MIIAGYCSVQEIYQVSLHLMSESLRNEIHPDVMGDLLERVRNLDGLPSEECTGAVIVRPQVRYGEWIMSSIPRSAAEPFYVYNENLVKYHQNMMISRVYTPNQVDTETEEDRYQWYRKSGAQPVASVVGLTSLAGEELCSAAIVASSTPGIGRAIAASLTRPCGVSEEVRRILGGGS